MSQILSDQNKGTLWVAATSLGDFKDIPLRSLEVLRTSALLIFEEDKLARQFLKAAGVQRTWLRYTEQKEAFTLEELEKELKLGHDVTYMSDQGTPGLADPGRDLVQAARRVGANVRPIPGPSAVAALISVCPLDCSRFLFAGFPPRDDGERFHFLKQHLQVPYTLILYETPYRMKAFFETLADVLSTSGRRMFVGVDISLETEEYWFGSIESILPRVQAQTEKRNFVVAIEGSEKGDFPKKQHHRSTGDRKHSGARSTNSGKRNEPRNRRP